MRIDCDYAGMVLRAKWLLCYVFFIKTNKKKTM